MISTLPPCTGVAGVAGGKNFCYYNITGLNHQQANDACVAAGFQSLFTIDAQSDFAALNSTIGSRWAWLNGIQVPSGSGVWYKYTDQTVPLPTNLSYGQIEGDCMSFYKGIGSGDPCDKITSIKYICQV